MTEGKVEPQHSRDRRVERWAGLLTSPHPTPRPPDLVAEQVLLNLHKLDVSTCTSALLPHTTKARLSSEGL